MTVPRRAVLQQGLFLSAGWPALAAATAAPGSDDLPPVEAFFGKPLLRGSKLSPDGRRVALTLTHQATGRVRLALVDLSTMAGERVLAAVTDSDIERVEWVGDEVIVFDTSMELVGYQRADYGPGLFAVRTKDKSIKPLVSTMGGQLDGPFGSILHWSYSLLGLPHRPAGDEVLVVRPEEVGATESVISAFAGLM